jgi:DNA mismatch repair protein MSH4
MRMEDLCILCEKDTITVKNLELVINIADKFSKKTLYGVLNKTLTAMGGRLLRMNILQPSNSLNVIQHRLNAVDILSESEECLFGIQSSLSHLADLDHIIAFIVKTPSQKRSTPSRLVQYAETKINHAIKLKSTIKAIKNIVENFPQDIKDDQNKGQNILLWKIHKVNSPVEYNNILELNVPHVDLVKLKIW